MANHVEKHLGNSDMEDSRTKKKCLCFEVCALCLSSAIESSRYMWQNLVESRWYPTASSAQIFHLWTIGFASSNDHLSKLKLPAHNKKKYNIYRGISNWNQSDLVQCVYSTTCSFSKPHHTYLSYIHACMGFKHHDLLFKYLNSTLHWLWPHLFFYTHTVVFSL